MYTSVNSPIYSDSLEKLFKSYLLVLFNSYFPVEILFLKIDVCNHILMSINIYLLIVMLFLQTKLQLKKFGDWKSVSNMWKRYTKVTRVFSLQFEGVPELPKIRNIQFNKKWRSNINLSRSWYWEFFLKLHINSVYYNTYKLFILIKLS